MSISLYLEDRERRKLDSDYEGDFNTLHLKHHTYKPQYAEFRDAKSTYDMELCIYDDSLHRKKSHTNMLIHLQGRIVHSVIESVIDNSEENHLKAIIDGCNGRLEQLEKGSST